MNIVIAMQGLNLLAAYSIYQLYNVYTCYEWGKCKNVLYFIREDRNNSNILLTHVVSYQRIFGGNIKNLLYYKEFTGMLTSYFTLN